MEVLPSIKYPLGIWSQFITSYDPTWKTSHSMTSDNRNYEFKNHHEILLSCYELQQNLSRDPEGRRQRGVMLAFLGSEARPGRDNCVQSQRPSAESCALGPQHSPKSITIWWKDRGTN